MTQAILYVFTQAFKITAMYCFIDPRWWLAVSETRMLARRAMKDVIRQNGGKSWLRNSFPENSEYCKSRVYNVDNNDKNSLFFHATF